VIRGRDIAKSSATQRAKAAVNHALTRSTGYQLTRVTPKLAKPARRRPRVDRLVTQPTFILSSVRSGSTLLRAILNSHSQICAPHELHLATLRVTITEKFGQESMQHLGLDERSLEYLLWDRLLHRELTASGKQLIVDKTPNAVFIWERLREAWPGARFIVLLRHPAAIADSLFQVRKDPVMADVLSRVVQYTEKIDEARAALPGITIRYEELVTAPERVIAEICAYLGVPWEPTMLDYGSFDHGPFRPRLGDWSAKIRSGQIDANIVSPAEDDIPASLRAACLSWGYLS
jgi:sulfotransferase family protein